MRDDAQRWLDELLVAVVVDVDVRTSMHVRMEDGGLPRDALGAAT